jgi:hypothetical protein
MSGKMHQVVFRQVPPHIERVYIARLEIYSDKLRLMPEQIFYMDPLLISGIEVIGGIGKHKHL